MARFWQHDDLGILVASDQEPRHGWSEVPSINEDELPDDVDYDKWYTLSCLSDGNIGVRVGPDPRWIKDAMPARENGDSDRKPER